jgi:hypothetical protein
MQMQPQQKPVYETARFQNPVQRYQFIMNAMANPANFVKEQYPDVPENIRNNPAAILNYLQQTRGRMFTQQMQQVAGIQGGR